MYLVNALSLAPDSRDWLVNSRQQHILHVFDHACNIVNERREVLSVVTPQIGNGPFNLVVEENILFSEHIHHQSPVSNFANQLHLGDLNIITAGAKLWSPCPDWENIHRKREIILQHLLSSLRGAQVTTKQSPSFCRELLRPIGLAVTGITVNQSTNSLVTNLSSALAAADHLSALITARKLAGLGIGLTPAGDDFILGAVLAAWIIHPTEVAKDLAEEVTSTAAPLTTSLSAAWLRSAGKGEAGIVWHEFFNALVSADPMSIRAAIDKILAVGETSGADALSGFISTSLRWLELRNTQSYNLPS